jgi:purine-binding chemotaxis protein CheW
MGLANLHGVVLPVVGLRRLLGLPEAALDEVMRVVVTTRGSPIGFVVDRIDKLLAIPADRLEKDDAGAGGINPDLLDGIIKDGEGGGIIKILNPQHLLRDEFSRRGASRPPVLATASISSTAAATSAAAQQLVSLLSFNLGNQEYALPLDRVREIIPLPEQLSEVPRSETAVLGVVTVRDRLLPLVSLRALLGLPVHSRDEPGKVVVLSIGTRTIGVVADRTREILRVDPQFIDPAPTLLTRGEGDAEVISICRLEQGKRLVAVLSPDRLFRSELIRRLLSEQTNENHASHNSTNETTMDDEQFIIFRLGDQEYGLPIAAVDEIARVPEQIARIPKAPAFVDGVINIRGLVLPVVDLRRRFDIASKEPKSSQRILVLAIGGGKTGFIVDSVSEVMKVPADAIRPAPEVSPEQMRLIGRVANLDAQGRMILLVDPAQLLEQIEAEVLAKFDRSNPDRVSKAS